MVSAALQQLATRADGAGRLAGDDVAVGRAEHPICGDVVELFLREVDGRIAAFGWLANGCPACIAVAAAAAKTLVGTSRDEVAETLRGFLGRHGGLASHERHAERMVLEAIERAEAPA